MWCPAVVQTCRNTNLMDGSVYSVCVAVPPAMNSGWLQQATTGLCLKQSCIFFPLKPWNLDHSTSGQDTVFHIVAQTSVLRVQTLCYVIFLRLIISLFLIYQPLLNAFPKYISNPILLSTFPSPLDHPGITGNKTFYTSFFFSATIMFLYHSFPEKKLCMCIGYKLYIRYCFPAWDFQLNLCT